MREIEPDTAERSLRAVALNLIRRGADGSLVMSADRWRLDQVTPTELRFTAQPPAPSDVKPLVLDRVRIQWITWDRLPKQRVRSQIRFHLVGGDLWTFSGHLPEPSP